MLDVSLGWRCVSIKTEPTTGTDGVDGVDGVETHEELL